MIPFLVVASGVLAGHDFALCFENMILPGWITEKLFDCFYAGTVPIYWDATDIERWVPRECFVDMRQFAGYEELRGFLMACSRADIEAWLAERAASPPDRAIVWRMPARSRCAPRMWPRESHPANHAPQIRTGPWRTAQKLRAAP